MILPKVTERRTLSLAVLLVVLGSILGVLPSIRAQNHQINVVAVGREQIAAEVTRRDKSDKTWEWKIPMKFYGLVLDQDDRPVPGADVHFQWTNLSSKGTADADAKTDEKGLFLLEGVQGKRLGSG